MDVDITCLSPNLLKTDKFCKNYKREKFNQQLFKEKDRKHKKSYDYYNSTLVFLETSSPVTVNVGSDVVLETAAVNGSTPGDEDLPSRSNTVFLLTKIK